MSKIMIGIFAVLIISSGVAHAGDVPDETVYDGMMTSTNPDCVDFYLQKHRPISELNGSGTVRLWKECAGAEIHWRNPPQKKTFFDTQGKTWKAAYSSLESAAEARRLLSKRRYYISAPANPGVFDGRTMKIKTDDRDIIDSIQSPATEAATLGL